ncbi:MAG TPA: hypothetical protein VF756_19050 [Thermoanaerobaculia bacterium]
MHLFIELLTLLFFLATVAHAVWLRGKSGAGLFGALLFLGFVRENFVILREVLYGFAPLTLMLGKAPVIASIIWGYSIYLAVIWAEAMTNESLEDRRPSGRFLTLAALFMIALACFYEPFLKLIDMARWQSGTRVTLDVPWITLIGYPSLTVLFLLLWCQVMRRPAGIARTVLLLAGLTVIALLHVIGLQGLKDLLRW